eukprot:3728479-Alexandrium_andersonii.AAC.1
MRTHARAGDAHSIYRATGCSRQLKPKRLAFNTCRLHKRHHALRSALPAQIDGTAWDTHAPPCIGDTRHAPRHSHRHLE